MKKTLLSISNLTFAYPGGQAVLKNINLQICEGDFAVILGPNGAAKTTLLKLMLGLLKPQAGLVELASEEKKRPRGYVPQKTSAINPGFPATVAEVVGLNAPPGQGQRMSSVEMALKRVDLWSKRDCLLGTLSGGQLQRVMIARALISSPRLLFLDEPFTGLDTNSQADFLQLIRRLNSEGLTIVLVTHDLEPVLELANRFLLLKNGQLEEINPVALKVM